MNVALWPLQAYLALRFAMAGFLELGRSPAMVEIFADVGVGQWFLYLVVGALVA